MESAFAWIGWIMEWFGQFIPRIVIVPTTHAAIKFRRGDEVIPLSAGLHFYWPLITVFKQYPIAMQSMDLRPQKLTTADDRAVLVGAMISYRIVDIEKALAHTWDPDSTIADAALRVATRVVLGLHWAELKNKAQKRTLDTMLKNEAQRVLEKYGVEVIEMTLTDLALTKVYSLVQSTNVI
jgi:regulator of protease activity HflC (stomatin/prohibitin superfamily)